MLNSRIREVRKFLKLTLAEFGSRLGVDNSTVSLWESGRRNPSPATIKAISREFNVYEEWLLTGEGKMMIPRTPAEIFGGKIGKILSLPEDDIRHQVMKELLDVPPEMMPTLLEFMRYLQSLHD